MPLDPQAKALLDQFAGLPPLESLLLAEARKAADVWRSFSGPTPAVDQVEDRIVLDNIPVRIYTPPGREPFGLFIFFHGGGWVIGDLDTYDVPCRQLANASGCVIVSVDYPLAPEHKFPVAIERCYAAALHIAANAGAFHADPARLAVGGDSAGGNLAAAVALMARDRGKPQLAFQVLVYPVTDARLDTPSARECGNDYGLTRGTMKWFWDQYLARPEDENNPYACPLRAADLHGLPPALVVTAEYDPLRDEGEEYAERLRQAGVKVQLRRYSGMIHGFFIMGGVLEQGKRVMEEIGSVLRGALSG